MERCPYCFKPLAENAKCDCGYEESKNARIEDALLPGSIIGACYQIGAVLGKGGFGITYCAFDLNMKKVVAIKEFYPDGLVIRGRLYKNNTGRNVNRNSVLTLNERSRETYQKGLDQFYREAVTLGKLDKLTNVVHAHYIFRENGTAYIVMEFVQGKSLASLTQESGRIPESELLTLLDPILNALQQVHEEGVLHRDIAPDNIMIENDEPMLIDFGSARIEDTGQSSFLIGKNGFSSPEQISGEKLDQRSDIYSLGAVYYFALSGIVPRDAAARMTKDDVRPLKDIVPGISKTVSNAVKKAMSLQPNDRFSSVSEFQKALKNEENTDSEKKKINLPLKVMAPVAAILACAIVFLLIQGKKPDINSVPGSTELIQPELDLTATHDVIETKKAFYYLTNTAEAELLYADEPTMANTPLPTNTAPPQASNTPVPTNTPLPTDTPAPSVTETAATDDENSLESLIAAAESGNPDAQYLLGFKYQNGIDVMQSDESAVVWYLKAAGQGIPEAVENLEELAFIAGEMYEYGRSVEQSDEKAAEWYRIAADRGNSDAKSKLMNLPGNRKIVEDVLMRDAPDNFGQVMHSIMRGTTVYFTGERESGWIRIRWDEKGLTGWIPESKVSY